MVRYTEYYSDEENMAISRLMEENGIKDFDEIEALYYRGLLNLYGTDVENIRTLECIKDWDFVHKVVIDGNELEASLEPLCYLKNLEMLLVFDFDGSKLEAIEGCRHLKTIQLWNSVSDISFLRKMSEVEELDVMNNPRLSDISAISGMTKMKRLEICRTDISDISVVRKMKDLEYLSMDETKVEDISPLAGLNKLNTLHMYGTPVKDISMLAGLPEIKDIDAQKTKVEDVSSFVKAGKLKVLFIEKSKLPKLVKKDIPKEIEKLKKKIEEMKIHLAQTISEDEIKEFEEKYKVNIPENYKAFVKEIGDGWEGIKINEEETTDCKRFKDCKYDEKGISRKFKYTESWIWEDDEEATDRKISNALKNGSMELMDLGDGMTYQLIVNGPSAGQVWMFTGEGVAPYGNSPDFLDWVNDILNGNIQI